MTAGLFRNFSREAAAKFSFFCAVPVLLASSINHLKDLSFKSPAPMMDVSWLSFYVAIVVAFLSSLLAIGAFMKQIQRGSVSQYAIWRILVAAGIGVLLGEVERLEPRKGRSRRLSCRETVRRPGGWLPSVARQKSGSSTGEPRRCRNTP